MDAAVFPWLSKSPWDCQDYRLTALESQYGTIQYLNPKQKQQVKLGFQSTSYVVKIHFQVFLGHISEHIQAFSTKYYMSYKGGSNHILSLSLLITEDSDFDFTDSCTFQLSTMQWFVSRQLVEREIYSYNKNCNIKFIMVRWIEKAQDRQVCCWKLE